MYSYEERDIECSSITGSSNLFTIETAVVITNDHVIMWSASYLLKIKSSAWNRNDCHKIYVMFPIKFPRNNLIWFRLFVSSSIKCNINEDYIKKTTIICNDHLTPELSLHLITPKCKLWYSDASKVEFVNDPFWAIYWPGGQALSRYILDNKTLFKNKNVIDIGSGSGACAIAAAKCDANIVVANDIDELSLKAIEMNANLNKVQVFLEKKDLIGTDLDSLNVLKNNFSIKPKWDIVLVGDMFYDSDFTNRLFSWLCELKSKGKTIFIGDPGRYAMMELLQTEKLVKVIDYPATFDEHFGFSSFSVWKLIL